MGRALVLAWRVLVVMGAVVREEPDERMSERVLAPDEVRVRTASSRLVRIASVRGLGMYREVLPETRSRLVGSGMLFLPTIGVRSRWSRWSRSRS